MDRLKADGFGEEALYAIYRDYIIHEDELVNNRVGWFIQLHSFLIASYTIVVASLLASFFPQGKLLVDPRSVQAIGCTVLAAISVVGFFSSATAYRSLRAATLAIKALRDRWERICPATGSLLPRITGGGSETAMNEGLAFHGMLPIALLAMWVLSLGIPIWFYALAAHEAVR